MYNNDREQENWKILKNYPIDLTSKIRKAIAQDRRVKKMTIFCILIFPIVVLYELLKMTR